MCTKSKRTLLLFGKIYSGITFLLNLSLLFHLPVPLLFLFLIYLFDTLPFSFIIFHPALFLFSLFLFYLLSYLFATLTLFLS